MVAVFESLFTKLNPLPGGLYFEAKAMPKLRLFTLTYTK